MEPAEVSIVAATCCFPQQYCAVRDLFDEEGVSFNSEAVSGLGIQGVHVCRGETGSTLALAAAQHAIHRAGLAPSDVNVIIDYSILPQEYLAPAWNMSNKLQHALSTKKAFTLGFSGGGATNFHVALTFAAALIRSDDAVKTALLVAADTAIPGNRILPQDEPFTVLGDGASAVVVQRGPGGSVVLDTELWSNGALHDVCYIPGGAMACPDPPGLYRMEFSREKYVAACPMGVLRRLAGIVLDRAGLRLADVAYFLCPNISTADQTEFMYTFGVRKDQLCLTNLEGHGHIQATDLVLNYLFLLETGKLHDGDLILACSHGMGFLSGVSLLRCSIPAGGARGE